MVSAASLARGRPRRRGVSVRGWGAAAMLASCLGPACAVANPAAAPADSSDAGAWSADVLDTLAELEAADQPLTQREVRDAAARGQERNAPGSLGLRWRSSAPMAGVRHDGRFEFATGGLAGRAAVRLRPGAAVDVTGGLQLDWGPSGFGLGHLTLRHGFGLVAVDPSRRASLGADRALGGMAGGLTVRMAAVDRATAPLAAVAVTKGKWTAQAISQVGGASERALRVARRGAASEWAAFASRDTAQQAASWSGRLHRPGFDLGWEAAGRRLAGGKGGTALVWTLGWRPVPAWRLELAAGLADIAWPGSVAVLPTGARSGWAVRCQWRERGHGALQLLLQGASQRPRATVPRRRQLQLAEVTFERPAVPGVTVSVRARHAARSEAVWSERAPWEPAAFLADASRTLLAADLDWERDQANWSGQWRSFRIGGEAGGVRQSLTLNGRRAFSRHLNAWAELTMAWGDPVDLVRALSPLPGLVVARHWGRWRSETAAGAALAAGPLAIRAALARRLPEPGTPDGPATSGPALEGWLEVGGSW